MGLLWNGKVMKRLAMPVPALVAIPLIAVLTVFALVALAQPPARWKESFSQLNRTQVHALLGLPDADFSPKGWDAWDKPVLVGAWVLTVYYDDKGQVTEVRRKFDWGTNYLSWDRDLQRRLHNK
jgi:hypothetical protein